MKLNEIFIILVVHWLADFVLQTKEQGLNKSKNWKYLVEHTYVYSLCWLNIGAYLQVFNNNEFFPKWSVPFHRKKSFKNIRDAKAYIARITPIFAELNITAEYKIEL